MSTRPDDLTELLTVAPAGMTQPMGYRQGVIVTFNQLTLQNTVNVGGTILTNLPVLGVGESSLLVPGSIVGLMVVGSTWAIIGRLVVPNTADAANAVSLLSNRTVFAIDTANVSTTSISYVDLPSGGTGGLPNVDITVGPSGKLLVMWAAEMIDTMNAFTNNDNIALKASIAMSGANTLAANDDWSLAYELNLTNGNADTFELGFAYRASYCYVFTGLNAGVTNLRMQYRCAGAFATETGNWSDRVIIAMAL
jgi:hypothetical protein